MRISSRILVVTGAALAVCGAVPIGIGYLRFVGDQESALRARVADRAEVLGSRLERRISEIIGAAETFPSAESGAWRSAWDRRTEAAGLKGIAFVKESPEGPVVDRTLGRVAEGAFKTAGERALKAGSTRSRPYMMSSKQGDLLIMAFRIDGGAVAAVMDTSEIVSGASDGLHFAVLEEGVREPVLITPGAPAVLADAGREAGSQLVERDWEGSRYFVARHAPPGQAVTVAAAVKSDAAWRVSRAFALPSLGGAAAVLALGCGLVAMLAGGVVRRIRRLGGAMARITQGDYEVTVDASKSPPDELRDLETAFNEMADKVEDHITQGIDKARMERHEAVEQARQQKEMEMKIKLVQAAGDAQKETRRIAEEAAARAREEKDLAMLNIIQGRYFPEPEMEAETVRLYGTTVPGNQIAGDWWFHAKVGDTLLIAIGDVSGPGMTSALVIAAAHGAFSYVTRFVNPATDPKQVIKSTLHYMNHAVYSASGQESPMRLLLCSIHLKTGKLIWANASQVEPYIYGGIGEGKEEPVPLTGETIAPLGSAESVELKFSERALRPGDVIVFYTDGLLAAPIGTDKRKVEAPDLKGFLAEVRDKTSKKPHRMTHKVINLCLEHNGRKFEAVEDDVTVISVIVPDDAQFSAAPAPAPAPKAA